LGLSGEQLLIVVLSLHIEGPHLAPLQHDMSLGQPQKSHLSIRTLLSLQNNGFVVEHSRYSVSSTVHLCPSKCAQVLFSEIQYWVVGQPQKVQFAIITPSAQYEGFSAPQRP
jgi:hypothetical protein